MSQSSGRSGRPTYERLLICSGYNTTAAKSTRKLFGLCYGAIFAIFPPSAAQPGVLSLLQSAASAARTLS